MKKLIFAFTCLFLAIPCRAKIIYADANGTADFNNIQAAINHANDDDTVIVADGIYTGEGNRNIDAGPGGVSNIIVRSENGPENCIIDGEGAERGFVFDALIYSHNLPIILLEGFTITNCDVAVFLHQTGITPTIKNCIITGNSSIGIACAESYCEIIDCKITNNNWNGIFCEFGAGPRISSCTITNNSGGGGIGCYTFAKPIIKNCVISGNEADFGGGLYIEYESEPKIYNTIITGNKALSGGGLYITDESNLNIVNCTITGNTAVSGGGFACVEYSHTQVRNSIIWNNTADEGPDIYRGAGPFTSPRHGFVVADFSVLQSDWGGTGNIIADPCFTNPGYWNDNGTPIDANDDIWIDGDYHLKSHAGWWDTNNQSWVKDDVNSPCIDAGDHNSDWTKELWPHGKRINMGAYGGTPEASMSPLDIGNIANLDNDVNDIVNSLDLALFVDKWCYEEFLLAEDLNRDGFVDFNDFALLAGNWEQTRNRAPIANAGPDITAYVNGYGSSCCVCLDIRPVGLVMMDGSASYDPDGDTLTFTWQAPIPWFLSTPGCYDDVVEAATPTGAFPVGTTTVSLTVSDGELSDTDSLVVTVLSP